MHYLPLNKISFFWLILLLPLHASVQAQETSFVQLMTSEPEFKIVSGEEQHILLSFLIKEGYHIQANQVEDESLIPSVLSIDAPDELIIGDPVFPQAAEFRMKGAEEALHVYNDVLKIKVPVKTVKSVEKRLFLLKGQLHYQACDAYKCYFPRDLQFTMSINIL
jgi:hypothetical protein